MYGQKHAPKILPSESAAVHFSTPIADSPANTMLAFSATIQTAVANEARQIPVVEARSVSGLHWSTILHWLALACAQVMRAPAVDIT